MTKAIFGDLMISRWVRCTNIIPGYERITHDGPVYIGDTISAESTVLEIIPSSKKAERGVLYVETVGFNQHNEKILTLRRRVLLPKTVSA